MHCLIYKHKKEHNILATRIILILVFALSVILKYLSHKDFVDSIAAITSFQEVHANYISLIIISTEVYLLLELLFSDDYNSVIVQTLFVIILFTIVLVYMYVVNIADNCFCFGSLMPLSPFESIVKNIIVIIIVVVLNKNVRFRIKNAIKPLTGAKLLVVYLLVYIALMEPTNIIDRNINGVDVLQLKSMIRMKNVLIIDARNKREYDNYHIPGAINVPYKMESFRDIKIDTLKSYKNNIVIYCDLDECSMSKTMGMAISKKYGNNSVYYLKGGMSRWLKSQQHI